MQHTWNNRQCKCNKLISVLDPLQCYHKKKLKIKKNKMEPTTYTILELMLTSQINRK